jgi:hypothetical protein
MKRVGILVGRERAFRDADQNINARGGGSVVAEYLTLGGVGTMRHRYVVTMHPHEITFLGATLSEWR